MKKILLITSILALSLSSLSIKAASLTVSDNLMIQAINGKAVNMSPAKLNGGTHIIELKYRDLFAINAEDSGNWVRSGSLFAKISLAKDEKLILSATDIHTEKSARAFVANPIVKLTSTKGKNQQLKLMNQSQIMAKLLLAE